MGEHVMVNGRELNFFDLPPEPDEYSAHVDGFGEIKVDKKNPPRRRDWTALAKAKVRSDKALRLACKELAATSGTCPYDAHDLHEPWEESCYQRCSADIDYAECWRRYFEERGQFEMSGDGTDESNRSHEELLLSMTQATREQVDEVSRSVIMSSLNAVADVGVETGDSERIGQSRKRYSFEHEEITCCADCPFFYDYLYCEIDERPREYKRYTWSEDGRRPDWCPLREVS